MLLDRNWGRRLGKRFAEPFMSSGVIAASLYWEGKVLVEKQYLRPPVRPPMGMSCIDIEKQLDSFLQALPLTAEMQPLELCCCTPHLMLK